MFGVWCGARVKHDLAKTQSSWPGLIIRKANTCLYVKEVWFVYCSAILSRKISKNVYNSLTEMTMCFCCCTVAEWTWKWYCCGYELVSNVVTVFKCHIRNVAFVCVSCELSDIGA